MEGRTMFNNEDLRAIMEDYSKEEVISSMLSWDIETRIRFYKDLAILAYKKKELKIAEIAVQRLCLLSNYNESILEICESVLYETKNSNLLREIYKRIGIAYVDKGDIENACLFFDKWQYTDATLFKIDHYYYDIDILDTLKNACSLQSFSPVMPSIIQKIRIGYLVNHATSSWSALMRAALFFAQYHNKNTFEIYFIILEPLNSIKNSDAAQSFITQFEKLGCFVVYPQVNYPNLISYGSQMIFSLNLHILISLAALSNFSHYAILSLRPAPLIVGAIGGPLPQYVSMNMDFTFSWLKHPSIDAPLKCYYILMDDKPKMSNINNSKAISKKDMGLPENCTLLIMAGRYTKFQDKIYWGQVLKVLENYPDSHIFILGARLDEIDFLAPLLEEKKLQDRVHFSYWQADYVPMLACADIFIDTYSAGGGGTVLDAAGLKIPIVAFDNDYMVMYSQMTWRLADELVGADYEGIIPVGDFSTFHSVLGKLITEPEYRLKLGQIAYERVYERHNNTPKGIKELENIFVREIENYCINKSKKNVNKEVIDILSNNGTLKHLFDIFKSVFVNKLKKKWNNLHRDNAEK